MDRTEYQQKTMREIMASRLAPVNPGAMNYTTVPSSQVESARNWKIQGYLGRKNFKGNDITRVVLPHDTVHSQAARDLEYRRQLAMPWNSTFMFLAQTAERLNNPAQTAAVSQRQLAPPSSYNQFYAFMHAMSAAFGSMQSG